MRQLFATFMLGILVVLPWAATSADDAPVAAKTLTIKHCVVSLLAEAQVSTRKPGVIASYAVAEGSIVKAGDALAQIDAAEAEVQQTIAERRLETAKKQAENDIDVRYAKAAAAVAKAEVLSAQDANNRVLGTVPNSEIRRLQLAEDRAVLGIEQADFQFAVAKIDTKVAQAQLDAAALDVSTRRVVSPIDGFVVRLHRHEGEWVDVGQPLCQVVGLDRLRVTGFVNVNAYDQAAVLNRPAKVSIKLANGKTESFNGTIGFASPLVQPGGEYRVWAEVDNRRDGEFWLLRPGLAAQMTITLK